MSETMKDKLDDLTKLKDLEFEELVKSYKLEKDLEEYDEDNDKKKKIKPEKITRYLAHATGFIYTLTAPTILLLMIYYVLTKYYFHNKKPVLLISLIVLGIITGYWSLFKEFNNNKK